MRKSLTKLFVIIDPTSKHQIALEKAILIAMMGDCEIHAFLSVFEGISEHGEFSSRQDLKHHTIQSAKGLLEETMQVCRKNNIPYTTEVVWNQKWYETAYHAIARSGCDLVLKSSFHHSKATRFFNKTSDFTLMRHCSDPILFAHQSQAWESSRIVACVELESSDAQHIRLNNAIVRNANAMAELLGMELFIAAAYQKAIDLKILRFDEDFSENATERLADIFGVKPDNMILRQGGTVETIESICTELEPSIMVIGTIARTGISGKLIGNTAEKLLDVINADILTIS